MVTQASQWKSKQKVGEHVVELPSGNEAKLRPIKPEAFLSSGLIPDPLTGLVSQAINSKKGLPPGEMNKIASDPKKLAAAMEMFDRALVYCVIEPEVEMPPTCVECGELYTVAVHVDRKDAKFHKFSEPERDPDILYADVVDMEDKQFIFQWAVGGVTDASRFREELSDAVESAQEGKPVRKPAKRAAGRK